MTTAQNRPVYDTKHTYDSTMNKETIIFDLFQEVHNQIIGNNPGANQTIKEKGSIVLPASNEEVKIGYKERIQGVSLSQNNNYLLVNIGQLDKGGWPKKIHLPPNDYWGLELKTYYLYNYNSGECINTFKDVTDIKFKNDSLLLISGSKKTSIYSINNKKEIYNLIGDSYFEFIDLNDDKILLKVFKNISEKLNEHEAHIISLAKNKVIHSFSKLSSSNIENEKVSPNGDYFMYIDYPNKTKTLKIFDLNLMKEIKNMDNLSSLFKLSYGLYSWSNTSNQFVYLDKGNNIKIVNLELNKEITIVENVNCSQINFICRDSTLVISPPQHSFSEGQIIFIDINSKKTIKEIKGSSIILNKYNEKYFIVSVFGQGHYYPVLYRFNGFSEVLRMKDKDKLNFDFLGKYLIMNEDKSNLYSNNRCQIIDLENNELILEFEDIKFVDYFDSKNKILLSYSNNDLLEFYDLNRKDVIGNLHCNSDGWLFFDKFNRYDCSSSFTNRIYFYCPAEYNVTTQKSYFLADKMRIKNLWFNTITLKNNESIKVPKLSQCGWWYQGIFRSSANMFTESNIERMEMPTVNYLIDGKKSVNLENYSGKPIEILKSEIEFQCNVWNNSGSRLLFMYFSDRFGNFVAITPDGYFCKSNNFFGKLALNINDTLFDLTQLENNFFRPDIIQGLLVNQESNFRKNNINGIKSPPSIKIEIIENKNRGVIIEKTSDEQNVLTIKIIATDNGGGIKGIRLFNNRKLVADTLFVLSKKETTFLISKVDLLTGENQIEAIGIADDYTLSKPTSISHFVKQYQNVVKPNLYIFGIAIDSYEKSTYNLNYCVKDMRSFVDTLNSVAANIFDSIYIKTLVNESVIKENIQKCLKDISIKASPNDVFVFFFAGHGIAHNKNEQNIFYFINHNVMQMEDIDNCEKFGFSGAELISSLKEIKANKQLSIIDACNSGALAEQKLRGNVGEENAIASLNRASGSAIFASTNSKQYASENEQIGHGVFTYVLLNGLLGGAADENCEITISSLENYLYQETPKVTEKYRGSKQYPTFSKYGQNYPIGFKCRH